MTQQHVLLALRQLGDAAHQVLNLIVPFPEVQEKEREKERNVDPNKGRDQYDTENQGLKSIVILVV